MAWKSSGQSSAETFAFTSSFDFKQAGGYSFTLNTPRLVVSELASPTQLSGGAQNHYDLAKLPANQWVRLKNFRGELLPVYLHWDNVMLRARVGLPPEGKVVILPVKDYSLEWQFQPQPNGLYKHPDGGFSLRYRQEYPWTPWYLEVSTTRETINFPIMNLPKRKWARLQHPSGGIFPIQVYYDGTQLTLEWIPLSNLR